MIGQIDIRSHTDMLINEDRFPRFSILVGPWGSGKKTLCKDLATSMKALYYVCENTVDGVRKMISDAYKVTDKALYVIADADALSPAAKNALLKLTEEPPKNAYIMMTLQSEFNTLPTLRSRGMILRMNPYTVQDITDYAKRRTNYTLHDDEAKILQDICNTPGDVNMALKYGIKDFYKYAEKVVDNVAEVEGANAFKIAEKLSIKGEEDKYDLRLFWRAFMSICTTRMFSDPFKYTYGIKVTCESLQELRIVGINKQSTFDMWLLSIREQWLNGT